MRCLHLLLLCAQLVSAALAECDAQRNCSLCAAQPACVWCTVTRLVRGAFSASGRCMQSAAACTAADDKDVYKTTVGECTPLEQLPCYNAVAGDVCTPAVVPDPPMVVNATLRGRTLYGEFRTAAGVRSALPETMCVRDGRLGKLGECVCRNHTQLEALAAAACREPPEEKLAFDSRRQAQVSCTALSGYRSCLARAVGRGCFVERLDRVCAALDHDRLALTGCHACNALHDQSTTTFVLSRQAPECAVVPPSNTSAAPQCGVPLFSDFAARLRPCTNGASERTAMPLDHALASWLYKRIERNSAVLQIGYAHSCLALYMASSARFRWIVTRLDNATAPPGWAPFDADAAARAQYMSAAQQAQQGALAIDWLLALEFGTGANVSAEQALAERAPLLERCRYAALLLWAPADHRLPAAAGGVLERELVTAMHARGFLYDHDLSQRARYFAALPGAKQSATVFLRRQLAARVPFPDFLRANVSGVRWNQQIPFGSTWLHAYVPRGIAWTNSRIVISIHSDPRFVEWRSSVRETWLTRARRLGMLAVFIVCAPSAAVVAEADEYNDIVVIEAPYLYHAERSVLPLLEHVWFQLAARHAVDASWVMKTDQDTIVFPDALLRFLRNTSAALDPQRQYIYAGSLFEVPPVRDPRHYSHVSAALYPPLQYPGFMSGGAGYIESMALVRCLTAYTATPAFNYFPRSDVGMRLAINEAGCQPLHIVGSANFHYKLPLVVPPDTVTIHYVKSADRLRDYWAPQLALLAHADTKEP
jgi:hypothetical protein